MTDIPPPDPLPASEDLVGQVVERAATKVAEASSSSLIVSPPVFGRLESWAIIIALFALLLINIVLNVQTKNAVYSNTKKIEAACKLAHLSQGAQAAPTGPIRVAECLD